MFGKLKKRASRFIRSSAGTDEIKKQLNQANSALRELERISENHDSQIKASMQAMQYIYCSSKVEEGQSFDETRRQIFKSIPPATGSLRDAQILQRRLLIYFDSVCRECDIEYWIDFGGLLGAVRHGGFIPWDDDIDVCMMRKEFNRFIEAMSERNDGVVIKELYSHSESGSVNHVMQLKYEEADKLGCPCCLDIFLYDYCSKDAHDELVLDSYGIVWKDHRREARKLLRKLSKEEGFREFSAEHQQRMKNLFDEHFSRYWDRCEMSLDPQESIVWAFDNFDLPGGVRFEPSQLVFPLVEIEYEGLTVPAPRKTVEWLTMYYGDIYVFPVDMFSHQHYYHSEKVRQGFQILLERYGWIERLC